MNKRKKFEWNIQFVVVAAVCLLVIISVIILSVMSSRDKTNTIEAEKLEEEERQEEEQSLFFDDEEVAEETESGIDYGSAEALWIFEITNRAELIDQAMGNWAYLMNEALAVYVSSNKIEATSAECIAGNIPDTENVIMEFYFECNDDAQTILMAEYDITDRVVEVTTVDLTREELSDAVWSSDGEPAVRDVDETMEE